MTYEEADKILGNKQRKKLANNTWLERRLTNQINLFLHKTPIITYFNTGSIIVDTQGWQTATTKSRLNKYLPNGWKIYQKNWTWYLENKELKVLMPFKDDTYFHPTDL